MEGPLLEIAPNIASSFKCNSCPFTTIPKRSR